MEIGRQCNQDQTEIYSGCTPGLSKEKGWWTGRKGAITRRERSRRKRLQRQRLDGEAPPVASFLGQMWGRAFCSCISAASGLIVSLSRAPGFRLVQQRYRRISLDNFMHVIIPSHRLCICLWLSLQRQVAAYLQDIIVVIEGVRLCY